MQSVVDWGRSGLDSWIHRFNPGAGQQVMGGGGGPVQTKRTVAGDLGRMINGVVGYGAAFGLYSAVDIPGYLHWWALSAFGGPECRPFPAGSLSAPPPPRESHAKDL